MRVSLIVSMVAPERDPTLEELAERHNKGDDQAYLLLRRKLERLHIMRAFDRLHNAVDAENAVEAAWVAIFLSRRRGGYDPAHCRSFRAWAWTIVKYQCISIYRKRHGVELLDVSGLEESEDETPLLLAYRDCIDRLPEPDKAVWVWRKVKGCSMEECHRHTGVAIGSMNFHQDRGWKSIRTCLQGKGHSVA